MGEILGLILILGVIGIIILIAWKGKDLLKMRTLQGGFFKQLAFWVGTPQNAQKVYFYSESGHISAELFPIYTGYMVDFKTMRAWLLMDVLKYEVYINGVRTNESVYLISERSYIPLDPNNRLTPEERDKLASLDDIAVGHAIDAILNTDKSNEVTSLQQMIVQGCFVMMGFFGILAFVLRKWG